MKVLLSWLREFVDVRVSPDELAHLLTMSGTEVGSLEEVGANWSGVRIGQVREMRPHPAAERLLVLEVDLGDRHATLITAATNLKVGDRVPVVQAGGSLRPGAEVEEVDFRGVRSQGMLCSCLELGISPDGEGICVLEEEAPVGDDLRSYLGDVLFDIELTPNRPDCLSVVGIAREISALTGGRFGIPPTVIPPGDFKSAELITVEIKDPDLCPRYSAVVLRGVQVKPSPLWMQRRLHLCGIRPISNIVDVTNYVMLERGQPLHAFDGKRLRGGIIVRRAGPGESMTTLDGETHRLSGEELLIADHGGGVAVAGVMGGLDSEVDESTTLVVLESANFHPSSIRRTSRSLKLATEASKRFDKGLDPELTLPSALRAASLMQQLAGGAVGQGAVDAYPRPVSPTVLTVTEREVERVLGLRFDRQEMTRVFGALGFETREEGAALRVTVPTFRRDVEGKADLAEELARIKGYDAIPTTLPTGALPEGLPEPYRLWEQVARQTLMGAGFQELMTYSLVSRDYAERLTVGSDPGAAQVPPELIPLANPMTPEQACLRTSLLGSLLRTVASNLRHARRAYLFELGRVYLPPLEPLPTERRTLGMVLAGPRLPEAWNSHAEEGDFFDLKGPLEALFRSMGIEDVAFEPARHLSMHPGRTARVVAGERLLGHLGEVHPTVVQRFDLEPHRVFAAEMDFETLISLATRARSYQPIPRHPAVSHDIAVVVDEGIPHAVVEQEIRAAGAPLLAEVGLFDLYQGPSIPSGKKSLAYSLTYRALGRTLTDLEVAEVEKQVVEALVSRFGAALRGR